MFTHTSKRGQALIIIVFAIIGLIAVVALAIDGGNVFLNRRSAQNAADNAALAGALAKAQGEMQSLTPAQIQTALQNAAISRAASNNFSNDASNTVTVNDPPVTGLVGGCNVSGLQSLDPNDPEDTPANYIQVVIHTTVNTYFAPIIGINTLSNCVEAIARVKPGVPVSLCYGALICALSLGPAPARALNTAGSAIVNLISGGAFSNSNNATESIYLTNNSTINMDPGFGLYAVGGIIVPPGYLFPTFPMSPSTPQLSYPIPDFMIPKYTCDYTINDLPQDLPGGIPYLVPGVYCVTGNFNKADYTNGTTGGTGIGGVTIVMINEGFTWQSNITLNAPTSGSTEGLLIYVKYKFPFPNPIRNVVFAGSGDLNISGTILAPDSQIQYTGNYATSTFRSQLVGWELSFGGGAGGGIYQPPKIYQYPGDARVELVK